MTATPPPLSASLAEALQLLAGRLTDAGQRPVAIASERELWQWIADCLGLQIPRIRVCREHCAPFDALAEAYFATVPRSVWWASREFGGKTVTLAALSLAEAVTLGSQVGLLGGSLGQSKRAHEYIHGEGDMAGRFIAWPRFPTGLLRREPTIVETRFRNGGWIRAVPASPKAVRGWHPPRLRGDELDEMEPRIWDSAAGAPGRARIKGIISQVVGCSTLQHADGTMARELKLAATHGWPIRTWCYRETMAAGGFVTLEDVARKQATMTTEGFRVEVELQEPAIENRAIQPAAIEAAFDAKLGSHRGEVGAQLEIEAPAEGGRYATGADLAKRQDRTIIWTIRTDVQPRRLVAYSHLKWVSWPLIAAAFDRQARRYPGANAYDHTGVGSTFEDLISVRAEGVDLVGARRTDLFQNWIAAVEAGDFRGPRIEYAYQEHKFCRNDDLYGHGHPPDSFVAAALAWRAASRPPLVVL